MGRELLRISRSIRKGKEKRRRGKNREENEREKKTVCDHGLFKITKCYPRGKGMATERQQGLIEIQTSGEEKSCTRHGGGGVSDGGKGSNRSLYRRSRRVLGYFLEADPRR